MKAYVRLVSVTGLALFALALVAACGGGDDDDGNGDTPAATNTEASAGATDTPGADPTDTPEPEPGGPIRLVAQEFAFNPSRIEVQAGVETTVEMTNMDQGVPHNFHVMAGDVDEAIQPFMAADSPQSLTFTIDTPGTYSFQCDVHPSTMVGSIVVN